MESQHDLTRASSGYEAGNDVRHRIVIFLFAALVLACAVGGGSARPDVLAVTGLRIVSVALLALVLLVADFTELRRLTESLRFMLFAAGLVAIQLIPLPPGIWASLPGHAPYAAMAETVTGPVWRPISMTPDLTVNALLALLIPMSAALAAGYLDKAARARAILLILALGGFSAVLGLLQLAPGGAGLRWYTLSSDASAIGLFANRNHHGVFLAAIIPLIAVVARLRAAELGRSKSGVPLLLGAIAASLGFAGMAIATGSRFGSIAALLGLLGGWAIWRVDGEGVAGLTMSRRMRLLAVLAIAGVLVTVALLALLPGSGVRRLFVDGFGDESRTSWLAPLWQMAVAFMPFGSGFGSFDSVYRGFEPFELLRSTYLNAAHNDLAQIVIEGGVGAIALVVIFLWWWTSTTFVIWSTRSSRQIALLGRAATLATGCFLLASLFDYPLRTPLLACFFGMLATWMQQARNQLTSLPVMTRPLVTTRGGPNWQSRQAELDL